jgi:hypothetical protein
MGDFDSLPTGSMLHALGEPGFEVRLRAEEPSAEREDMDAKVEAAGGYWKRAPLEPRRGIRPGRMVAPAQPRPTVYLIPSEAFDSQP